MTTRPPTRDYAGIAVIFAATAVALFRITSGDSGAADPRALIPPVVVLVGLTGGILIATAIVRNLAVFEGRISMAYFRDYVTDPPAERLERPARTFNNLLQVPLLFYTACALMIATGTVDEIQVSLAWLFVGTRVLHAAVYLAFNYIAYRFAIFASSTITLTVLWVRFAGQAWPAS